MLKFVLNARDAAKKKEVKWHVGEKVEIASTDIMDVDSVQADGAELAFVKKVCPAVYVSNQEAAQFDGNDAMEVAAMLLAKA